MTSGETANPEGIKHRIQDAYRRALRSNTWMTRSGSSIDYLLRHTKLYGRDAGIDFVETHFDTIVQEALAEAECRKEALTIQTHGFGRAAVDGMRSRLAELTSLRVEVGLSGIDIVWTGD